MRNSFRKWVTAICRNVPSTFLIWKSDCCEQLLGESREELSNLTEPVIILAHDLTPGETATLNTKYVLGFATEVGGHTSHTAILAGALEIPPLWGLGDASLRSPGAKPSSSTAITAVSSLIRTKKHCQSPAFAGTQQRVRDRLG
jgi:phosphoenolpyruvate-protein kinase (PTS system EI component)